MRFYTLGKSPLSNAQSFCPTPEKGLSKMVVFSAENRDRNISVYLYIYLYNIYNNNIYVNIYIININYY